MFLLNGKPLAVDTPFSTEDGSQYPANWLRLASEDEKVAIGITEVPDPVRADDRFYWNGDISNPKPLGDIQAMLVSQIKATAGSMLAGSDWKVVRAAEGVKPVDQATLDSRAAIRAASNANEAAVMAATSVDELAVMGFSWPEQGGV